MSPHLSTVPAYGYLAHVQNTVQDVVTRVPVYRQKVLETNVDERGDLISGMLNIALEDYRRACKIKGLSIKGVWVGGGLRGYCWSMYPDIMSPKHRSQENFQKLEAFKKMIGATGEPTYYPSFWVKEPESYKTAYVSKETMEMLPEAGTTFLEHLR